MNGFEMRNRSTIANSLINLGEPGGAASRLLMMESESPHLDAGPKVQCPELRV